MIEVSGANCNFQLGKKSNNKSTEGNPVVCSPVKLNIEPSSIISYSIYNFHAIMIKNQNKLLGIGFNKYGEI